MKLKHSVAVAALTCLVAAPAFADTFAGKIAYKNADGAIVSKSGEIDLTPASIDKLKLRLDGVESLSDKIRVKRLEGENRQIVIAVFRNIRDMPAKSAVIVKGSLIEGSNGKLFYGDVLTRTCKGSEVSLAAADESMTTPPSPTPSQDDEDGYLDRLSDKIQEIQDSTGCATEYRGGVLLSSTKAGSVNQ